MSIVLIWTLLFTNLQKKHSRTFQEEDDAYLMVTTLSWILPLTVILCAMLDALLVWVYMKFAHPWKDILFDQEEDERMKKKYY